MLSHWINFAMIYVLTFIIYMTVVQFGGIVATNVVKEATELWALIVTTKPKILILEKYFIYSGSQVLSLKINGAKYIRWNI